jgi:putative membrane protein
MWFWGTHAGGWWLWMFFYILFLAGLVLLIIVLVRLIQRPDRRHLPPSSEEPLEIIKKRYAKGEINREQFEQMKKDLED